MIDLQTEQDYLLKMIRIDGSVADLGWYVRLLTIADSAISSEILAAVDTEGNEAQQRGAECENDAPCPYGISYCASNNILSLNSAGIAEHVGLKDDGIWAYYDGRRYVNAVDDVSWLLLIGWVGLLRRRRRLNIICNSSADVVVARIVLCRLHRVVGVLSSIVVV